MVVEIICVGTELLLGNIVNTNAAFLAEECALLGLSCYYQSVVGDNEERLSGVISQAVERADVVILCGGLGPTEDDLTKEVAAKVMGCELILNEEVRSGIEAIFAKGGHQITENNFKQALVPVGARILKNDNGTAPGLIMEKDGTHVVLLPGPPGELKPMWKNSVKPYLDSLQPGTIVSQMIKVCGIGESLVETMCKDLIDNQTNPTIATYAKTGEVHIRVTAQAEDEKACRKLIKPMVKELKSRFGANIYSTDADTTLAKAIVDLLIENKLTVTTAESCTGGMLSSTIVDIPGASDMFKEGFVTYSNKAKRKHLGVKKGTLLKYGAVSEQVAKEMAKGGCAMTKSDCCVAITGIAGPDGGTEEKPVGLVYIGVCVCGTTVVREYRFSGSRTKIRESSTVAAMTLLRECLLTYFSKVTFGKAD